MKVFRDPIYEYIRCAPEEIRLIDSPWFQRLRHCSQNGATRLVYPSLLGTRFEHSLGVMELAGRMIDSVLDRSKYDDPSVVDRFLKKGRRELDVFLGRSSNGDAVHSDLRTVVRMAGLCHDIGHFPLSHTLERTFKQLFWVDAIPKYEPERGCHETVSAEIVRQMVWGTTERATVLASSPLPDWVARGTILNLLAPKEVVAKSGKHLFPVVSSVFQTLSDIIVGHFDVDRLDYMQRDGHLSGTGFGRVDVERLIQSMYLVEQGDRFFILPSSHAMSTIESALIERYKEFKWVCYHHKALFFGELCHRLAITIFERKETWSRLFKKYPGTVHNEDAYRKKVLSALGNPDSRLPPLNLYRKGSSGLLPGGSYFTINADFFIQTPDTHFFDDVWFCCQCRTDGKRVPQAQKRLYRESLVDRKKCGLTLWKDLQEFKSFRNKCLDSANKSPRLARLGNGLVPNSHPNNVIPWMDTVLTSLLVKSDVAESASRIISQAVLAKVNSQVAGMNRGFFLLSPLPWGKLFGKFGELQALGKQGGFVAVKDCSNVLAALEGVKGEIPFFAYLVGLHDLVLRLEQQFPVSNREALLDVVASGFVDGLLQCWNNSKTMEIKQAWSTLI